MQAKGFAGKNHYDYELNRYSFQGMHIYVFHLRIVDRGGCTLTPDIPEEKKRNPKNKNRLSHIDTKRKI